jgi:hypothetical protein
MPLNDFLVDVEASANISGIKLHTTASFQAPAVSLPLEIIQLLGEIKTLEGRIRHLSAEETLHLITLCHRAANEIQNASLTMEIQALYIQKNTTTAAVNAHSPETNPQMPGSSTVPAAGPESDCLAKDTKGAKCQAPTYS